MFNSKLALVFTAHYLNVRDRREQAKSGFIHTNNPVGGKVPGNLIATSVCVRKVMAVQQVGDEGMHQ